MINICKILISKAGCVLEVNSAPEGVIKGTYLPKLGGKGSALLLNTSK